jgi:hypothetical protein
LDRAGGAVNTPYSNVGCADQPAMTAIGWLAWIKYEGFLPLRVAQCAAMRSAAAFVIAVLASLSLTPVAGAQPDPAGPVARVAASVCADYSDQAAAQQAADTRDADGDGIYCVISPR